MAGKVVVADLLGALDRITGGRLVREPLNGGKDHPFVITKDSGVPGKAVTELPGLVWGKPENPIDKVAVLMTLTENAIELAASTGVQCLVAHHPVADACNSGGVTLKNYLDLYGLNVVELHEALHGLHPGIPWLHGHRATHVDIQWGGVHGNIVYFGETLPGIKTLGDILQRLSGFMGTETEKDVLEEERRLRLCEGIEETCVHTCGKIVLGTPETPVRKIIHIFPHTGFSVEDLDRAYDAFPDSDTVLATISRVYPGNPLIDKAKELGLNFVCGNSHAMEIFENGLPLARALAREIPDVEVRIFRERMCSVPVEQLGSEELQEYGRFIADDYLPPKN